MSIDRKTDRAARPEVKATPERKTMRVRPSGSATKDRLSIPQWVLDAYPDCQFMWQNDENGAVQVREQRGWTVVRSDMNDGRYHTDAERVYTGSAVSIPVGPGVTTGNLQAVLMMMPREWFEEDLKAQEAQNKEIEGSLRRGSRFHGDIQADGTYDARLSNGGLGYSRKLETR